MLNWFAGIANYILDNHPLWLYLSLLVVYYLFIISLFVWRRPRFLARYLNIEVDRNEIIREINEFRRCLSLKNCPAKKLHAWQKERGI